MKNVAVATIVPGDVVLLEAGNFVAADCRVLEGVDLQTQESALTGESAPIHKTQERLDQANLPLGDRRNMVYRGTFVTAGRGLAVVVATGMKTELGRIAGLVQSVTRETIPLERRLEELGRRLALIALCVVVVIFVFGLIRGEELKLMFLTAVSIGVAAIPEGLPAAVTITLALGAKRMLKRKALIRKLSAIETLGSVTVICSDKTGTLTKSQMSVAVLALADRSADFSTFLQSNTDRANLKSSGFGLLLAGAVLCNDSVAAQSDLRDGSLVLLGDPTENAFVTAASQMDLSKTSLDRLMPRVGEIPFSSERKRMTTIHQLPSAPVPFPLGQLIGPIPDPGRAAAHVGFTKGAPSTLLDASSHIWVDGKREILSDSWRARLTSVADDFAGRGMRILAVACRLLDGLPAPADETLETDLTFVGIVGMIDPPREDVGDAVATCKAAGVRPVMITGDHPLTAQSIANQIGMRSGETVTGSDLDRLSISEWEQVAEKTAVYARVSPEHKLKIVQALQAKGEIVAMTGDGVNDAPAIKKANIGIAMGMSGTDVAKETADLVLLDDNFVTIVSAVREGRLIYDNLRKFLRYILATNSGEILVMLIGPVLGMPLPLLPLQILWMNLVTDGLPALALALEPAEADAMRRPPRPPEESVFARGLGRHVVWIGLWMGLLSVGVGYGYWRAGSPDWQTIVFTTLTFSQMAQVLAIRSERNSLFTVGLRSNLPLLFAVILTVVLQLALVYVPLMRGIFHTRALSAWQFSVTVILSLSVLALVEFEKWRARHYPSN